MDFSNIQFQRIPIELISNNRITNLQFRILCNLLKYSLDDDHSYLGSFKMAEVCNCGRAAYMRAIKELERMGFVEIKKRGNFSRSNDILLTMSNGLAMLKLEGASSEPEVYLNDTPQVNHNESPTVYLNDSRVSHYESRVNHNETPHIDDRFKKLNLNKLNARDTVYLNDSPAQCKSAPADVTAGQSMPTSGSAGSANKAEAEGSQLDIEDLCLWQAFKSEFPQRSPWFQLVRAQHRLIMRGIGKMGDDMLCRAWPEVLSWFSGRGFKIEKAAQNQRFYSEIVIKEAV